MLWLRQLAVGLLGLSSTALALSIPRDDVVLRPDRVRRQDPEETRVPDSNCPNTARSRHCWRSGYSIETDFDAKSPPEGGTVTYNLEITNMTLAPDGKERRGLFINGQYPGPTIFANWGDDVIVNVKNSMPDNGTSIHWHGIRQLNSCQMDGVNGITQCAIAPNDTYQYRFKATQFGTSWYHSHFSVQYGDGVAGPIVINGPATMNYDEDLGVLPLTDWYYTPAFELNYLFLTGQTGPPLVDNVLVNGTMINADGGGQYQRIRVEQGKSYRLRLINMSVDSFFHVSLDGHPFHVITSDFVPIEPFETQSISLAIGQRYDVVFTANQTVDNYWLRVNFATDCGTEPAIYGETENVVGAILEYDGADSTALPTSSNSTAAETNCLDEMDGPIVPWVPNTVPEDRFDEMLEQIELTVNLTNGIHWLIDGTAMDIRWHNPTLEYVLDGNGSIPDPYNIYDMNEADEWYFWIIEGDQASIQLEHPIHLHGHDFYFLGAGDGPWDGTKNGLNFENPTRRDTAVLPAGGHMVLAFPADNPGAWLMHCHIAWHVSQGLSLEFLERRDEIAAAIGDVSELRDGCQAWDDYWFGPHPYEQDDSGL
ncbi:multicopper oxidase-domain-containing protein [Lineolata rhizophorae]|uniref:laccase n=1 Tax=Lineolata rhizophorae TaxID=578093 RepID=A0A6A6PAJ2_9PEZI|nr:multicopper oxidase-domain-containing protein [Lineolata rhizophorae]